MARGSGETLCEKEKEIYVGGKMQLDELFESQNAKKSFELWINNYPKSYHPLDMKRFEKFIVSLFVNNETIDYKKFEYFLKTEKKFNENDCEYFSSRIREGLSILQSYKNTIS